MRILSSVLFFLGLLAASANTETCPTPEEMEPCDCDEDEDTGEIRVSCLNQGTTLADLKKALNSLSEKKVTNLVLFSLNLGRVPSDFFYGIGVKKLEITYCELDSLTDEDNRPALLGLEDSLEELRIMSSFSKENKPAKLKLGHLRKLEDVIVTFNNITELSDDWFDSGPVTLKILTISNNGIEKVGDRAFANLVNLLELSFDGNLFGSLKRSMLPNPAGRLVSLELNNNDLTSLPEDIFTGMPSLRTVSLRKNNIARLEQRTWQPIWKQLWDIYLEENPLECDSHIEWMFKMSRPYVLKGKCVAPDGRKDQDLKQIVDDNLQDDDFDY